MTGIRPAWRRTPLRLALVFAVAGGLVVALTGGSAEPGVGAEPSCPPEASNCVPAFSGSVSVIDPQTRARMKGVSWRRGCPVGLDDLRLLEVSYWGFDQAPHQGRLVVHRGLATGVLAVVRKLYENRFPIRRMRLIDAYGASDHKSMAADNTSAFNCRFVAGRPGVWSQHAYGRAIDVNPVENPYVTGSGHVSPPAGRRFAKRSKHAPGMVHGGDATVGAFADAGWEWGGNWPWPKDYQHFSSNGR